ncbi:MAG: hypothetical protein Q7U35_10140 [Methanobacteriaceae archaeon]|nr:hypothetical protein [Methanobacteriaceae archaeon]MDP2835430.1 hypothetical protein [Methanobacteriaceae archaeon]MDP3033595.1 hypothetical protein [Methanobacteriaceae archaeon]MDP3623541.1 hypothetical protein [Methanobacteriaceae archaeon]
MEDFNSFIDKIKDSSNINNESDMRKFLFVVFAKRLEARLEARFYKK